MVRFLAIAGVVAITQTAFAAGTGDDAFMAQSRDAMNTMMMATMNMQPTGDVDADFVAMMIPHHQAAIDMAKAELRYGHNGALKTLAGDIIRQQQQEITVMRRAVPASGKRP